MHVQPALIAGIHPHTFRSGQPAHVVGIAIVRPDETAAARPCFVVAFPDGQTDYFPISDIENYRFLSIPEAASVGIDLLVDHVVRVDEAPPQRLDRP